MSLTLGQTATAVVPNLYATFFGIGGTTPYGYTVLPGGAGGTINATTGAYKAPSSVGTSPETLYDTVMVVDHVNNTSTAQILVGTPLLLFCEIIQTQMGLATGRVYLWDQKIFQPTDNDLYIAVAVPRCKPFSNTNDHASASGILNSVQSVNMWAEVTLDIISRGTAARDQKELVILALNSDYCQSQQEINGFYVSKLPTAFQNLSEVDGAAIPYRYRISVALQYFFTTTNSVPYYSTFSNPSVTINP